MQRLRKKVNIFHGGLQNLFMTKLYIDTRLHIRCATKANMVVLNFNT